MTTDHNVVREEPSPELWLKAASEEPLAVPLTRLDSHTLRLSNGQRVGISVGGQGIPLVLAHGFSFAGGVYVQSLARLGSMGFKVIAVDLAGHGTSAALVGGGHNLDEYRRFLGQVLDELGVQRSLLVGHSLGGRLVAELAAAEPERAVALLLVDAAVGAPWDDLAAFSRWAPGLLGLVGVTLAADTFGTLYLSGDQGLKLRGLAMPQAMANMLAPWRLIPPALSVLLAPASTRTLERLARRQLPVFVLHGDRDPLVPLAAAHDASRRAHGELVVVHGATHSWPLEDPETLRAVVAELLGNGLGAACLAALSAAGLDPDTMTLEMAEKALCAPGALVHDLAPHPPRTEIRPGGEMRYRWTRTPAPPVPERRRKVA